MVITSTSCVNTQKIVGQIHFSPARQVENEKLNFGAKHFQFADILKQIENVSGKVKNALISIETRQLVAMSWSTSLLINYVLYSPKLEVILQNRVD